MRVLLIALSDDPLDPPGEGRYGGAQLFMFDLCRHLVRKGHYVILLTRQSRPDKRALENIGPACEVHRIRGGPEHELSHHDIWQHYPELKEHALKLAPALGKFFSVLSYNWISGVLATEMGVSPIVHHILSLGRVRRELGEEPHPMDEARDAGELRVFAAATRLICVCNDELASLRRLYPEIDPSKAVVIPYPVDANANTRRPIDSGVYLRWKTQGFTEGP
jgi:Glycosyltransferase Family 4